jgi:hypothetical protein
VYVTNSLKNMSMIQIWASNLTWGRVNNEKALASLCMSSITSFSRFNDKASISISFFILFVQFFSSERSHQWGPTYLEIILPNVNNSEQYQRRKKYIHLVVAGTYLGVNWVGVIQVSWPLSLVIKESFNLKDSSYSFVLFST